MRSDMFLTFLKWLFRPQISQGLNKQHPDLVRYPSIRVFGRAGSWGRLWAEVLIGWVNLHHVALTFLFDGMQMRHADALLSEDHCPEIT
jgi:hypothetical protein